MNRIAFGAALALSIAVTAGAWAADGMRVGTAGPVVANATGIMPDGTSRPLVPGQEIFLNEKIVTDRSGRAEILFADRSSLSIGPNSDTTIDDFAYSPADGTGKIDANTKSGLVQFTGGALSKRPDQVTVRTPIGIMGVRGGIAVVQVDNAGGTTATFLYGKALTLTALNGGTVTINQPGYFTFLAAIGGTPTTPAPGNLGGVITVLYHGPAGTAATAAQFEAALIAGAKTLDGTTNAAKLLANANFFKTIQGAGGGGGGLPACPGGAPRTSRGTCI
jgi:hypothetical protein